MGNSQPKSFLVPERERVGAPPRGIIQWLSPVFLTSNLEFIHKCGLDAYFFLRYLRMLLKIFLPMAIIILPILLPINRYSGPNGASGLDLLSISNVRRAVQSHRLWAHLILAVAVIMWVCYVTYKEMRGYISVRQAYLTSPQHRIRASATTVLVTGIPKKWLTVEALNGLYDVFPGGIRNIWINRNFDALSGKVSTRDGIALDLEAAETNLIKMCRKAHLKKVEEEEKKSGMKGKSKEQKKMDQIQQDQAADRMAEGNGTSAGDEHRAQTMHERLHEIDEEEEERHNSPKAGRHRPANPLQFVNQGFGALGQGLKGFGTVGTKVLNDVTQGMTGAVQGVDHTFDQVNAGTGFMSDEELYRRSHMSSDSDVPPTPPPKQMKSTPLRQSVNMDHGYSQQFSDFEIRPQSRGTVSMDLAHDSPRPANGRDISDEKTPSMRLTRPSGDTKPKDSLQIEEPIVSGIAGSNAASMTFRFSRILTMSRLTLKRLRIGNFGKATMTVLSACPVLCLMSRTRASFPSIATPPTLPTKACHAASCLKSSCSGRRAAAYRTKRNRNHTPLRTMRITTKTKTNMSRDGESTLSLKTEKHFARRLSTSPGSHDCHSLVRRLTRSIIYAVSLRD